MLAEIDFSSPVWLLNYYHFIGTFSLVLNSYVLFLVIFKSDKIDNFKYFLLAFQSSCLMVDVHMTLLMQPQPLYPIPAGFSTGLLSPYIACQHLMTAMITFMVVQFGTLTHCFFQKFISINKIERADFPIWKRVFVVISATVLSASIALYYELCGNSEEETFRIIIKDYPEYLEEFKNLDNFAIYELNIYWLFMLSAVVFGFTYCSFIIFYSTRRIFEILGKFKSSMSPVTYRKHRVAIMSLIAQLITSVVGMFPPSLLCVLLIIEFQYAQITGRFLLMIYSTHASINATVLVITTPPFRRFTVFWERTKTTPLVVSMVRGNNNQPGDDNLHRLSVY